MECLRSTALLDTLEARKDRILPLKARQFTTYVTGLAIRPSTLALQYKTIWEINQSVGYRIVALNKREPRL